MNKDQLQKLKNNPYYKLSQKQQTELEEQEKEPMIEFGYPQVHNTGYDRHDTTVTRRQRTSKGVLNEKDK